MIPPTLQKVNDEARAFRAGYASVLCDGGGIYTGEYFEAWVSGRNLALHEAATRKEYFHA